MCLIAHSKYHWKAIDQSLVNRDAREYKKIEILLVKHLQKLVISHSEKKISIGFQTLERMNNGIDLWKLKLEPWTCRITRKQPPLDYAAWEYWGVHSSVPAHAPTHLCWISLHSTYHFPKCHSLICYTVCLFPVESKLHRHRHGPETDFFFVSFVLRYISGT